MLPYHIIVHQLLISSIDIYHIAFLWNLPYESVLLKVASFYIADPFLYAFKYWYLMSV